MITQSIRNPLHRTASAALTAVLALALTNPTANARGRPDTVWLAGGPGAVNAAAVSPAGDLLATGSSSHIVEVGDPAPTDPSELTFLSLDTRTPYTADYAGGDANTVAHYMLRWVNTRGDKGGRGVKPRVRRLERDAARRTKTRDPIGSSLSS